MAQLSVPESYDRIRKLLPNFDVQAQNVVASELLSVLRDTPPATDKRIDEDLLRHDVYFVVRDSDLELLPKATELIIAAAAKMDILAAAKLGGLLLQYWRKRAQITLEQADVLFAMKTGPTQRWTPQAVWQASRLLRGRAPADVLAVLQSLLACEQGSGGVVALVRLDPDSTWTVLDV
jgi:hypothetical protein